MTVAEQRDRERQNWAIDATADALLASCAVQTGTDPQAALDRALQALADVMARAEHEARQAAAKAAAIARSVDRLQGRQP